MSLLFQLGWYYRAQWQRYLAAMLMLAVVAVLNLVAPWLVGTVVDHIAAQTLTYDILLRIVGWLAAAALTIYVLRYAWRLMLYSASYRLGSILRQRLYEHWLRQPAAFFQQYGSGDLMARATNDVTAVEMSAGEAVLALFDGVMVGLLVLGMLFLVIDWRLAALALIPWPVMGYSFWRINNQLHQAFVTAQARFSDLNDQTLEQVSAIRLLRAYGLEQRASHGFDEAAREAQQANLKVAGSEARYEPVIFLTMGLSFLIALSAGAWFIHRNELTVGDLTRFTLYLGQLIWPMFAYGWLLNLLERGRVAYQRIQSVLDTEPAIQFHGDRDPGPSPGVSWNIRRFAYNETSKPALEDFQGSLAPGKTLGIVGETGAGKSTFVQLLGRQYESPGADFRLNGVPLEAISQEKLRQLMAFVPQESFLFSTTLADNIALGKPGASPEAIREAARLAAMDKEILGFPKGYETPVGERGVTLSGGQKQRIAIARVMLMESPLVILDDALSAVDVATEKEILANLKQTLAQRTTLIVSHRLSAVEQADEIIVLKKGRVVERGSHHELLQQQGWYAEMYRYQQLEHLVEEGR
ncbi:MAG: ABC transporter transmembrane domain-containing protein [Ketobacteraceae bacterium]|nr:ABC transporter transmembrane domain-containing protein [Ketobacteraceae bacterium]